MDAIPVTEDSVVVDLLGAKVSMRYLLDDNQITFFQLLNEQEKLFPDSKAKSKDKEKSIPQLIQENPDAIVKHPDSKAKSKDKEKSIPQLIQENPDAIVKHMDKWINLFVTGWEGGKLRPFQQGKRASAQLLLNDKMIVWLECIKQSGRLTFGGVEEQKN